MKVESGVWNGKALNEAKRVKKEWWVLLLLVACFSCSGKQDPFFGRWTVEKVNVEFREDLATPEMVRQYGELEKGNVIEITADSVLTLISSGDTATGHCTLRGKQLYHNGTGLGRFEGGKIYTETATPLGAISVIYQKEKP